MREGEPNRPVGDVECFLLVRSDDEDADSGASKSARSSRASASASGEEAVVIATAREAR